MIKLIKALSFILASFTLFPISAFAEHAWNNYHWARTTTSFNLTVINSTTSDWDAYITRAVDDWSGSNELNMVEDQSGATSNRVRRKCNAPGGMVRICNLTYGQTGWLGIAGISVDSNGHIVKGYTKLNDTYFGQGFYDDPAWKQSVTCQELGHNVGLGHQDEDFNNATLLTCMDYQNPPFEFPNAHDYQQISTIYGHTDPYNSYDSGDSGGSGVCNAPPGKGCNKSGTVDNHRDIGWGMSLGRRGQMETFIRIDADGIRHITHVIWVTGF